MERLQAEPIVRDESDRFVFSRRHGRDPGRAAEAPRRRLDRLAVGGADPVAGDVDELVAKAEAALASGLDVILCVGESDSIREAGAAVETVSAQLDASLPGSIPAAGRLSVAYEPIWAIGTGKIPSNADIGEMHAALRARLKIAFGEDGDGVRILYGGSVKPSNAAEIFAVSDVDGALVGGASLKAADFLPIVEAAADRD